MTRPQQHSTSVLILTERDLNQVAARLCTMKGPVDAVLIGPSEPTSSQTSALRGTDNQEIPALTLAGQQFHACDRPRTIEDRRFGVSVMANGEVRFAGIPDCCTCQQFRELRRRGVTRTLNPPPTERPA